MLSLLRAGVLVWLVGALLLPTPVPAQPAASHDADIYLFWRPGCPHCEREIEFLQTLVREEPRARVHYFSVLEPANGELLARLGPLLEGEITSVPITIIGRRAWVGFGDAATTGQSMREQVAACVTRGCDDLIAGLVSAGRPVERPPDASADTGAGLQVAPDLPDSLRVPLVGEVALKNLSLPALTVVLGALDGFNPCAMWVLALLLGILVGLPDVRRRWLLGGAFLVASAGVYFAFMAAWLNLFLFVGLLLWVQVAVGVAALAAGIYYLRQYALRRDAVCAVTAPARRRRVFERLRGLVQRESLLLALGGIVVLAAAVNVVELLCSAGLPAIYTRVLTLSHVPAWQYYGYLLLYIAVFLLDDLVVFFTAMKTLEVTGIGARYARQSRLAGGLVLTALGVALILRPDWLMFG